MNMNRFLCFIAVFCFALTSCKKEEEKQKEIDQAYYNANDAEIQAYIKAKGLNALPTGKGTFYSVKNPLPTKQGVNDGDSVIVHFKIYLLTNETTPVDTTSELRNLPDKYLINTESILPGLEDALRLMHEGEEATILIPSYRALAQNSTHKIPPYSSLRYELKLVEVRSEYEQMEKFISQSPLTVTERKDSVRRMLITAGSPNKKPQENEKLFVNYTGRLLNGTRFDQNIDTSWTIFLGTSNLIPGFTSSVRMMNYGETSLFVFPSSVGYGRQGSGSSIPPYAPLSFQLTLVKPERLQLQEYFASKGYTDTVYTSTSGIYHRVLPPSGALGAQATSSSKVKIKYKGLLLDGTPIAYSPTTGLTGNEREDTFTLTDKPFPWLVQGLREIVGTMKVNEKRMIFLPSPTAFNIDGYLNVRRRTPIMFEVELKEIQ